MKKLTFNILLSLIIQAKRQGKGRMGNGRILANLLIIAADFDEDENTRERSILHKFNDEVVKANAYHKIDKLIGRFLPEGRNYPYDKFKFKELEKSIGKPLEYGNKLNQMNTLCTELFEEENAERLVYTLLEIVRHDSHINNILYGDKFVLKEELFGNTVHNKRICIAALLLGLVYYTHINHSETSTANCILYSLPEKRTFSIVEYKDENSLNLNTPVKLEESIFHNAKNSDINLPDELYDMEFMLGDASVTSLPEPQNIFLYGIGGMGKTTTLVNEIKKNSDNGRIYFFIPLSRYSCDIYRMFSYECSFILQSILLKYHYQNEYRSIESCVACEGEKEVLKHLYELENILKSVSAENKPKYVLILDGMNEISTENREYFKYELERNVSDWSNVQFIISDRKNTDLFPDFERVRMCGISENIIREKLCNLPDYENILQNEKLMELMKSPLFLNMYLSCHDRDMSTRGEILDAYIKNIADSKDMLMRFIILYVLPFVAKYMTERHSYEISRADISEAAEKAINTFIRNERVYQNYTAPQEINRSKILKALENFDIVEMILKSGFLEISEIKSYKLHFLHQYYRDYFAARYILNLLEALKISYEYKYDEKKPFFNKYDLGYIWFNDDDEDIYRLIGEICGDYKNADAEENGSCRTILDDLLDMCREFDAFRTTENVIRTMALVRNNLICDVNFSCTSLPMEIPADIKFHECDFSECFVLLIEACDRFDEIEEHDHFKDCDFTDARFLDPDYKEILKKLGAEI